MSLKNDKYFFSISTRRLRVSLHAKCPCMQLLLQKFDNKLDMIIVHLFKDTSLCCLLVVIFLSVEKERNARYVLRDTPLAEFAFVFFPGVREIFGISWGYSRAIYSNEQNARLFGRGRYFALNYKLSRQNCWVK